MTRRIGVDDGLEVLRHRWRVLELAVGADLDAGRRAEAERVAEHGLGVVVAGDRPERLTAWLVVPPDRCLLAQDPPRRMRIARHEHVEVPEVDLVDRRGMRGHRPSLAGPLPELRGAFLEEGGEAFLAFGFAGARRDGDRLGVELLF